MPKGGHAMDRYWSDLAFLLLLLLLFLITLQALKMGRRSR